MNDDRLVFRNRSQQLNTNATRCTIHNAVSIDQRIWQSRTNLVIT